MNEVNHMQVLPFSYGMMKKYIIFSRDENGKPIIYYVYRIYATNNITELTTFKNGKVDYITQINTVLEFDIKNPATSIRKFKQLLILQTT